MYMKSPGLEFGPGAEQIDAAEAGLLNTLPTNPSSGEPLGRIEQSIAYMKQHLDRPLKAAALAAQASVSLSHFFALFKRETGYTPIDYFIHLRMDRARELLGATSLSVKEVATLLGYDDPFYFSRVFKTVTQLAPTQYRRRIESEGRLLEAVISPAQQTQAAVQI
jgi:transcriptional regulator GlxA family with amidase domain